MSATVTEGLPAIRPRCCSPGPTVNRPRPPVPRVGRMSLSVPISQSSLSFSHSFTPRCPPPPACSTSAALMSVSHRSTAPALAPPATGPDPPSLLPSSIGPPHLPSLPFHPSLSFSIKGCRALYPLFLGEFRPARFLSPFIQSVPIP
jgi:hypothetical protein